MARRCETCKFYQASQKQEPESDDEGTCRLHPKTFIQCSDERSTWAFPHAFADDWCGHWTAKPKAGAI